jgi:hypothetical protein
LKVTYMDNNFSIEGYTKLANVLDIKNKQTMSSENGRELIGLVKYEEPDLLIIDDSLKNLKNVEMKRLFSRIDKNTAVFVDRTNGTRKIMELQRINGSFKEKHISIEEFLGKIKQLKFAALSSKIPN